jgi:predicted lipoprotein with Yx(FWY)xxD motif
MHCPRVTARRLAGLHAVRIKLLPIALIAAAAFAGCGSSSSSANDDPVVAATQPAPAAAAASARGPKLKVISSDYGRILADGRGRALYLFTADHGKGSNCYGDCATAWPPYIVKSKPTAVSGAVPGKVGTILRSDGTLQATYAGHPVYYYEGDRSPGEVNCQAAIEFGGYWYVLRSSGKAVH